LMTAQQDINFKLLEDFAREGIEFAYPTQKLFLARA
jgi:small-conductance mechanosensitive channel